MKQLVVSSIFFLACLVAIQAAEAADFVCSGTIQSKATEKSIPKKFVRFSNKQNIETAEIYRDKGLNVSVILENNNSTDSYLTIMASKQDNKMNSVAKGLAKNMVILAVTQGNSTYSIGCSPHKSSN